MFRIRLLAAVALAVGLFACGRAPAQPVVRPVAPAAALPVVPGTVPAFVTLKVSDLAKHPDLKPVLAQLAKQPDVLAGATEVFGVSPLELDRVTLFWPRLGRGTSEVVLVVTTVEPFNEARVLKTLRARPASDREMYQFRAAEAASKAPAVKIAEPVAPAGVGGPPGSGPGEAPPPKSVEPGGKGGDDLSSCAAQVSDDLSDPPFYFLDGGPFAALFLVDERTLVFLPSGGSETAALSLLGASLKKGATGPLTEALNAANAHTVAAGVYLPPMLRQAEQRVEPELVPYTALLPARTAVVTGDLDKNAKLSLTLKFEDATAAKRAGPVLEEAIASVVTKAETWVGELGDSRRPVEKSFAPILAALAAGLKKSVVKVDGSDVVAVAEMDFGPASAKALGDLLQAFQSRRKAIARLNNLKHIGLALHNYHDVYGRLPTNVYGPKGEMLLSWRVQLLPYMEQDALYRQFRLDEPWDSEHNKKLIEQMPKVFQAPDRDHAKGKTFYQAFVQRAKFVPAQGQFGRPWLKDGEKQGLTFTSFADGLSNTLAVVETREGVEWTKPDDLPFGGAVPLLGEKGADRTPALRFDGSVCLFPTELRPELFWPHVTIDGGEVLPDVDTDRRVPFGFRSAPATEVPLTTQVEAAPKPVQAPEPEPLPLPRAAKAGTDRTMLEARVAVLRALERNVAAQSEAAALVLARFEKLVGKGAVTQAEVSRAQAVHAESLARLAAARRATEAAEAALKAVPKK